MHVSVLLPHHQFDKLERFECKWNDQFYTEGNTVPELYGCIQTEWSRNGSARIGSTYDHRDDLHGRSVSIPWLHVHTAEDVAQKIMVQVHGHNNVFQCGTYPDVHDDEDTSSDKFVLGVYHTGDRSAF